MKPHAKSALAFALAIVGGIAAGMRCDASEWVENPSQTNPRVAAYTVKTYTEGSDPFYLGADPFYLRVRRLSTTVQSIGKSEHQRAVSAGDIKGKAVFGNGIARMQRDRRRFLDD